MKFDAVLIAGPTASGKSAAALALATHANGVIINADSMQVYRELKLLTARPSPEEEARVPHRLYGIASVHERYSSGRYQSDAADALAEARALNRLPIFVGGTGLYFDVLSKGLSPIPDIPPEVRARIRAEFEAMGREAFAAALATRDPMAAKLRISDTQRLLRAADVFEATGQPLSEWQKRAGQPPLGGLRVARFVLAPSRELLAKRSAERIARMFAQGAIDEAQNILRLDASLPAAKALGLPQLWRYLVGDMTLEAAAEETQLATRQYMKRQLTWFRNRMRDWIWVEDEAPDAVLTRLRQAIA